MSYFSWLDVTHCLSQLTIDYQSLYFLSSPLISSASTLHQSSVPLDRHALIRNIQDTIGSPALLCKYDLLIYGIHIWLIDRCCCAQRSEKKKESHLLEECIRQLRVKRFEKHHCFMPCQNNSIIRNWLLKFYPVLLSF